ncbi:MAG: UvrD-helicase domain-containing protein [Bdellovibrionales bacterium]|nr:UvrD-helicase domain-containing protein [Bdellovibrionales bacterium]
MARALEGLNPQQKKAVEQNQQNLLVVAGAGSGKTRVLTHKIVYLIEELGIAPQNILAMTFSNKAASEMKARIQGLLDGYDQPQWIGTFHSICLRLLKEFHRELGRHAQITIYDDTDQLALLKSLMKERGYDPKQLSPKIIKYQLDQAKNHSLTPLQHLKEHSLLSPKAMEIAQAYQDSLEKNQAMDFGDLLRETILLLQGQAVVKKILHQRWSRILIDEYQDTNVIQKMLIQELLGEKAIVCAVGDEDQAIYSWRGARVENMLEFEEDFSPAQTVKLDQNYRSTKQVLSVANDVIRNNSGRREKNLWTDNHDGQAVEFFLAEDDYQEAAFVLDKIAELSEEFELDLNDFCILYRTHAQSRLLEEQARKRNLAYKVYGGIKFYERAEVKDVLAFLKLAINPFDNVAFERIINKPARGIGNKSILKLKQLSVHTGLSMLESIPKYSGSGKAIKSLGDFYLWFHRLQQEVIEKAPSEIATQILEQSGYLVALENEGSIEADGKIENIEELLRSIQEFEHSSHGTLFDYMDYISLHTSTEDLDQSAPMLTFMTIHNSKGLEFPNVFLVGMEEGIFPHQRSIEHGDPEDVEEERRLCYVAMTRAEERLYLTASARRKLYKFTQFNPVSRFIQEVGSGKIVMHQAPGSSRSARYSLDEFEDDYAQVDPGEDWDRYTQSDDPDHAAYKPGTKVVHPNFGQGVVKRCEGNPDNLKLTIAFTRFGQKKILLNYCELEIVHL